MNKDNAKDYLPFVQALAEGKTIQVKQCDGTWGDIDAPLFNTMPEYYRIKTEPKEIRVNEYIDGRRYVYSTIEAAEESANNRCSRVAVHYKEVQ